MSNSSFMLDPKAAWDKLEGENLDAEQKIALWTLLPSKVRIKNRFSLFNVKT